MRKELAKKLLAIALALVVGVTFVPLLGDNIFAEEEGQNELSPDPAVEEPAASSDDALAPDSIEPLPEGATDQEIDPDDVDVVVPEPNDIEGEQAAPAEDNAATEGDTDLDATVSTMALSNEVVPMATIDDVLSMSISRSGTIVTLNAYIKSPYNNNGRFRELYVDGRVVANFDTTSLSNYKINVSNSASPGYHSVKLGVYTADTGKHLNLIDPTRSFRMGILSAPSAKGSLAIYHNYLDYMSPTDPNLINYKLFLEYSLNGKTWKTYGPMNYIQTYKLKGLKANRKYFVRSYYGVYRDGTWFTSKEEGKTRWIGTYRTGVAKRPAVKSIKVKAYKVKKKTQRVYGYYTGLYLGKRKYYKYKLKIIVTLKQKPGNKIWINGKKFKGNKKKYTVNLGTFTSYSKPKGKKYKVAMYTYRSASWGGYSPMYKKVLRIK